MPSLEHDGVVELFRSRPALAAELLQARFRVEVDVSLPARTADSDLTQLVPINLYADLVIELLGTDGRVERAIVVEVQRGADEEKRWTWPSYLTAERRRARTAVSLLVVACDEAVARWAVEPIETGHPGFTLEPLVLGPSTLPLVLDRARAVATPELAVLGLMAHGGRPEAVEAIPPALDAVDVLDRSLVRMYIDLITASATSEAAQNALEAELIDRGYDYDYIRKYKPKSDFFTKQPELQAMAWALLEVLEARGFELSDEHRARVKRTIYLDKLTRWVRRAATASSLDEVFAD